MIVKLYLNFDFRPNIIGYTTEVQELAVYHGTGALEISLVWSSSALVHKCQMYVWCAMGLIPFTML